MSWNIGILGPHICSKREYQLGFDTGAALARAGAILVCGGLDGMMTAAAEGARSERGKTVGILPGTDAAEANPFIDVAVPTGLGAYRNVLIPQSCHAVIAIRGAYGTLSEIGMALRLGVPVVGLETWTLSHDGEIDGGIHVAKTAEEAATLALALAACRT